LARARPARARGAGRLAAILLLAGVIFPDFGSQARAAEPGCRPEMAEFNGQGRPRIQHAAFARSDRAERAVLRAALAPDQVRITFVGHASFLIETPNNVKAVTDYNDFVRATVVPDVATMNKAHSTHYSRNPEAGITHLLPGWNPRGGKAEHDVTLLDMRIRNVSTNIRMWGGGDTEYDGNSIFIFEINELCVVHLGHLHHTLEPGHIRAIGRVDVLLVPVDGGFTLDMAGMMDVVTVLNPRVIIPMHFFGPSTLARFLDLAGARWPVERSDTPVLTVSRQTLPDRPRVIVLPGR
jgi:L-ascorbate metabolism protein UlaG (beta-lactamase superfamily)